ncbi:hypothetical protein [Paraburkholderia unamae]|uniref:Uncharacterized protein n=1 Tax=Paraburkholderia unamae TaxID=219649 RepID=A0ACC6RGY9_9BURK
MEAPKLPNHHDKTWDMPGTCPGGTGWDPMQFDQQVSCDDRVVSKLEPHETAAYEKKEREISERLGIPLWVVAEQNLAGRPKLNNKGTY